MERVQILLVDSKNSLKSLLEKQLRRTYSIKFSISLVGVEQAGRMAKESVRPGDVVLFGEDVPVSGVTQLAKSFRVRGFTMPLLMLTKQSEARVPRNLRKAGVDDMVNIAEIDTPLFFWTFMSTLKQAEVQKKAQEFDVIKNRLKTVHRSLAFITHEINNPLGVIRLTLHHLKNPNLAKKQRQTFFRILAKNVKKVDTQIIELQTIRRQLGEDTSNLNQILLSKTLQESS